MDETDSTIIRNQEFADSATQRTIVDLIDVESGEMFDADTLDTMTEAELARLRDLQSLAKQSGEYKYVCAVCGQPLRLNSPKFASKQYRSYFFSHYSNVGDCPLKTRSDALDPIQSTIKWYEQFKESDLHKDMCRKLMDVLAVDGRFGEVGKYPSIHVDEGGAHWHKPDVSSIFQGRQLVFETLLYNTFLGSITDRNSFYRLAESFLLWLFPHFSIDDQRMCEKDVYYTHRRNIFVFDSEDYYQNGADPECAKPRKPAFAEKDFYRYAQEESMKRGRLMLNCYWQTPVVDGDEVKIEWHHKLVDMEDLSFDAAKKEVFFHDSDKDFKEVADPHIRALIENWERAKEERWDKIFRRIRERKERSVAVARERENREKKRDVLQRVYAGELIPEPFEENGKFGYRYDDVIVIRPQYLKAFPFRNGKAIVIKKGGRGLINTNNDSILENKYGHLSWIDTSKPGLLLAGVRQSGPYYLLNSEGEKVAGFQVTKISRIDDSFIFVKFPENTYGLISSDGRVIIDPAYDRISVKDKSKLLLKVGRRTKTVSDLAKVKTEIISEVMPGFFVAERLLLFGIVDEKGKVVVPFEYTRIEEQFSDNYLRVEDDRNGHVLFGLLNHSFKVALPLGDEPVTVLQNGLLLRGGTLFASDGFALLEEYDSIDPCPDGKFVLEKSFFQGKYYPRRVTRYGLADSGGKVLFPCMACTAVKNTAGNVRYSEKKLKNGNSIRTCFDVCSLFDQEGKMLVDTAYDTILELPNGTLLVKGYDKYGILDNEGAVIAECRYDHLNLTESGEIIVDYAPMDGFAQKASRLDKYALADRNGVCLTGFVFDDLNPLVEGIYLAAEGSGRMLLDKNGKLVYSSNYRQTEFRIIDEKYVLISELGKCGVIDREGSVLVPTQFSAVDFLPNGTFKVSQGMRYGIWGADGRVLYECKYSELVTDDEGNVVPTFMILDGTAYAARMLDKYALCSEEKIPVTDYVYDRITSAGNGFYIVFDALNQGVVDRFGKIMLPLSRNAIVKVLDRERFIVRTGTSQSVVNEDGTVLFDFVRELDERLLVVGASSGYGLMDRSGKVILPLEYDPIFEPCSNGIIMVRKDGLYGLCDVSGSILAKPSYQFIRENSPGSFKLFYLEGKEQKAKFLHLEEKKPFSVGSVYAGTVNGVQPYGVFVKVAGYGFGLIHAGQLRKRGKAPEAFSKGDSVSVKVIRVSDEGKVNFDLDI